MSTGTQLVRHTVKEVLARLPNHPLESAKLAAHPGLLLQRGWTCFTPTDASNEGLGGKTEHLRRIACHTAGDWYQRHYNRWKQHTADPNRFAQLALRIDSRLLIGLAGGGALETGCAIHHSYGMPYLPGSSIKGAVRAWAEGTHPAGREQFNILFGDSELSAAGLVAFHDAWWVPDSGGEGHKQQPFVLDMVTPHHPNYQKGDGSAATDLDSPVPNALLGVRGSFLFVLEGDPTWLPVASAVLKQALDDAGMGAKTRAGYGRMTEDRQAAKQREEQEKANADKIRNQQAAEAEAERLARLPPDERRLAEFKGKLDEVLHRLPKDPRDGKPIRQATTGSEWKEVLSLLEQLLPELQSMATDARLALGSHIKQRLNASFKVEGKAEKALKELLKAVRGES